MGDRKNGKLTTSERLAWAQHNQVSLGRIAELISSLHSRAPSSVLTFSRIICDQENRRCLCIRLGWIINSFEFSTLPLLLTHPRTECYVPVPKLCSAPMTVTAKYTCYRYRFCFLYALRNGMPTTFAVLSDAKCHIDVRKYFQAAQRSAQSMPKFFSRVQFPSLTMFANENPIVPITLCPS